MPNIFLGTLFTIMFNLSILWISELWHHAAWLVLTFLIILLHLS
jgi:hypothetical protein